MPEDAPRRPWTPSYSSYTQGPGISDDADEDKDSINSEPVEDHGEPTEDIPVHIEEVEHIQSDSDDQEEPTTAVNEEPGAKATFPKMGESLDTLPDKWV